MNTLDHKVPFGYLGTLGTFLMPCTTRYPLDTVNHLVRLLKQAIEKEKKITFFFSFGFDIKLWRKNFSLNLIYNFNFFCSIDFKSLTTYTSILLYFLLRFIL